MTAVQIGALNADILRSLGKISEDETVLQRVAKYLRKQAKAVTDDPTRMTKEEYVRMLDESHSQYEQGRYTTQLPGESVADMLRRNGYGV